MLFTSSFSFWRRPCLHQYYSFLHFPLLVEEYRRKLRWKSPIVILCVFSNEIVSLYYIQSVINTILISLSPAVFTLFTGNLRVEHPFVIFYRVSLLQVEFIHLIVSKVGVVEPRSRLWKQITAVQPIYWYTWDTFPINYNLSRQLLSKILNFFVGFY